MIPCHPTHDQANARLANFMFASDALLGNPSRIGGSDFHDFFGGESRAIVAFPDLQVQALFSQGIMRVIRVRSLEEMSRIEAGGNVAAMAYAWISPAAISYEECDTRDAQFCTTESDSSITIFVLTEWPEQTGIGVVQLYRLYQPGQCFSMRTSHRCSLQQRRSEAGALSTAARLAYFSRN